MRRQRLTRRGWLLLAAALPLAGQAQEAGDPRARHRIPAAQLQQAIAQRFPLRYDLGGLLALTVGLPRLRLMPLENRLGAAVPVEAAGPALQRRYPGGFDMAFGLRYERADQTVRAHQIEVLEVRWPELPPGTADLLRGALPELAQQAIGEVVLHQLRPQDLALPDAMGLEPQEIRVTAEGVTVFFGPRPAR